MGEKGIEYERQIKETIRGKMRMIGPNCLGVMNPVTGFNATFAHTWRVPAMSPSSARAARFAPRCWTGACKEKVGFSAFVSLGSMLDVGWGDLIYHLGDDPNTHSIVIYMETIGDARAFLSAAREVALTKPIIVIKAGRTAAAAKAAASHTGSLTGSDEVCRRRSARRRVARRHHLRIVRHGGSAGQAAAPERPAPDHRHQRRRPGRAGHRHAHHQAAATGRPLAGNDGEATTQFLPPTWSHNNPVDIIGDAEPELYAKAVEIAAKDPNTDGLLVILTPQAHDRSDSYRREAEALRTMDRQSLSWQAGWAEAR